MEHQPAFPRRYSAFVSYSHRDSKIAARLAARIERYRLPAEIAGRVGAARLKPVFRDREELTASPDLGAAVREAIGQADYLIVVSTRHTPGSVWVGREIALFRHIHADDRILAALFEPSESGCFHAELMRRADGSLVEPLAADFCPGGDGSRLAVLKLIATLAGVRLDDLVQRDARRQIRRTIVAAILALLVLAAIMIAVVLALRANAAAAAEQARGADAMHFQLNDLRAKVKAAGTLELAEAVNSGVERFYNRGQEAAETIDARLQHAELFQARAEDEEKRGDLNGAWRQARAAFAATAALSRDKPSDSKITFSHAQSAYWLGFVAWRAGNLPLAEKAFDLYARLAARLVRENERNPDWQLEQGYASSNLGMLALREAHNWPRARSYFVAAQHAFAAAARQKRDDPAVIYELADGEAWLADVDRLSGALAGAAQHRREQRRLIDRLLLNDPRNALYRAALVANQIGLARVVAAQGQGKEALRQMIAARATATELARRDPADTSMAREKRAVDLFLVEDWLAQAPPARPRTVVMAHMLECAADWRIPHGEELATLCSLLRARLEVLQGHADAARQILANPRVAPALAASALSPRWRMNFGSERAKLETEIRRSDYAKGPEQ